MKSAGSQVTGTCFLGLNCVGGAMAGSVWRGFRPLVSWVAICTKMAFYGTQVWQWQVLHVWA
jgi:hypothetical protein